ncbi:12992_t:CDS:2 [Entrophospora sp. SA101]|nr:12992_t:CDS:2 [Entrophospora sp. SA101]CAJ0887929.1 5193_t:CDS:2 [Entrophospora sp. SA101]CAJ0919882.1 10646_t:CDS:2 [Entrophospora sp. SA101]
MEEEPSVTIVGEKKKGKGGPEKSNWIWNLMEETEIVKDGEKSKGAICQVNV